MPYISKEEQTMKCNIVTKTAKGEIKHTRTIEVESRQALRQDVKKWVRLGVTCTPEISETPEGELLLIWTERR